MQGEVVPGQHVIYISGSSKVLLQVSKEDGYSVMTWMLQKQTNTYHIIVSFKILTQVSIALIALTSLLSKCEVAKFFSEFLFYLTQFGMAIGYIHSFNTAFELKNYSTDERFDHAHIDTFPNNRQQKSRMLLEIDKE